MVKAMTRGMYGTECIIASRKGCSISNLLIGYRHALAAEGIDRYAETVPQGCRSTAMVTLSIGNENTANAAALRTLLYNSVQICRLIYCRINPRRSLAATAKDHGIGAWPRHDRRVGGQDDCIGNVHRRPPTFLSYALGRPRHWRRLRGDRHVSRHSPGPA